MNDMSGFAPQPAPLTASSAKGETFTLSRRGFLTASVAIGGGLMLEIALPAPARAATGAADMSNPSVPASKLTLVIDANDGVTLVVPGGEMGQGINAALAQIVAEELPLDFSRILTVPAPWDARYGTGLRNSQVTGGSQGIRKYFDYMLTAGATARCMLFAAAAADGGDMATMRAVAGYTDANNNWVPNKVVDGNNRSWTYGQLATAAAAQTGVTVSRMSDPNAYQVIGKKMLRPDIRQKVNGQAIFGLDVMVPGMKFAAVRHAPTLGSTVSTMGVSPAGTQVVNLGNAVAVVASNSWQAKKAVDALTVTWTAITSTQQGLVDTSTQTSNLSSLLSSTTAAVAEATPTGVTAASVVSRINAQPKRLALTYTLPMLAHASMEVLNCTVEPRYALDGSFSSVNVWAPTQAPDSVANTVSALLPTLDRTKISVTTTLMGGAFGRKIEQDYISQAVQVALAARGPVKLMWWREEDFARDFCRPAAVSKIQVGLDASNVIQGWYNRVAAPSVLRSHGYVSASAAYSSFSDSIAVGSAIGTGPEAMPYAAAMTQRVVDYVEQKTGFSIGFWRSVGQSISCFAVESAIDEVAKLLGVDPYAYRASLVGGNAAMKAVLDDVAALSNWSVAPPAGTARGLALSPGFGSHCAMVAEVKKIVTTSSTGVVTTAYKVPRVFCSVDCGLAVNPDQVKCQIEGAVLQGMNAARWNRMQFDKGICQIKNFGDYKIGRMSDAPQIIVNIIGKGPSLGGIGEVGVPPVAPALANAYAALTGTRKRSLPLGF